MLCAGGSRRPADACSATAAVRLSSIAGDIVRPVLTDPLSRRAGAGRA
jgi:hypothetical protein